MKITDKEGYKLIQKSSDSFAIFYEKFNKTDKELLNEHIIIDFSQENTVKNDEISLFLNNAESHSQNGTSFVVVCSVANIDDFPETFNIVPTLVEAEDVIEMENIQRDLGF